MTLTILFGAQFTASKVGVQPASAPLFDLWRIARSDGTKTQVVTGGATTYVGRGIYQYLLADADPLLYIYAGAFYTSTTTVDLQEIPVWQQDWSDTVAKDSNGKPDISKIEGTDATDQIRDAILSDATRFAGANVNTNLDTRFDALDSAVADVPTNAESAASLTALLESIQGVDAETLTTLKTEIEAVLAVLGTPVTDIAADIAAIEGDWTSEQKTDLLDAATRINAVPGEAEEPIIIIPGGAPADTCAIYVDLSELGVAVIEGQQFTAVIAPDEPGQRRPVYHGSEIIPAAAVFQCVNEANEPNTGANGIGILFLPYSADLVRGGTAGIKYIVSCPAANFSGRSITVPSQAGPINIKDLIES